MDYSIGQTSVFPSIRDISELSTPPILTSLHVIYLSGESRINQRIRNFCSLSATNLDCKVRQQA